MGLPYRMLMDPSCRDIVAGELRAPYTIYEGLRCCGLGFEDHRHTRPYNSSLEVNISVMAKISIGDLFWWGRRTVQEGGGTQRIF